MGTGRAGLAGEGGWGRRPGGGGRPGREAGKHRPHTQEPLGEVALKVKGMVGGLGEAVGPREVFLLGVFIDLLEEESIGSLKTQEGGLTVRTGALGAGKREAHDG